jgi:hypothetical protein
MPLYVVVSDGRVHRDTAAAALRIEQLPSGFTAGELARRLADGSSLQNGHLRMLVCPTSHPLVCRVFCDVAWPLLISCGILMQDVLLGISC